MFKLFAAVILALACSASAKPLVAYSAPLVAAAPGVVTSHSSQYIARNYNGVGLAAYSAPVVAAAYTAPVAAAYSAPVAAAYTAPVAAAYAAPYAAPYAAYTTYV